jgi:hypothetical protein
MKSRILLSFIFSVNLKRIRKSYIFFNSLYLEFMITMAFFQPIINLWIDHVPTLHNNLMNSNKNKLIHSRI